MKYALELSNHDPYERVAEGELNSEEVQPVAGDTIVWDRVNYIAKERIIDYDEDLLLVRATRL